MKMIPLTQGKAALVSDKDYAYLRQWKWCLLQGCYAVRGDKSVRMHVVIARRMGLNPNEVDHRDRNSLNNQRRNLRPATKTTNGRNRGPNKNNSSGFKGIHRDGARWRAQIRVGQQRIHLGRYATPEQAAAAYNKAAKKYFKSFAYLNPL